MKIRANKIDRVFSRLIRVRDEFTCQKCGRQHAENSQGLHASHFFSRRHQSTRHDPDNACAHCMACHQYLGENPIVFQSWIRTYLGDVRYSELCFRANQIVKRTQADKDALYAHLKSELARLEDQRAQGATGVLSVVPYE